MKTSVTILVLGAGIIAVAIGWIYQTQYNADEPQSTLEIPLDIDYYLAQFTHQTMTESGTLNYELRSPYLQHFKRDDISQIDTPTIDIYRNNQHWKVSAKTAKMYHQENSLNLVDNVLMQRQSGQFMQLNTQFLRFEADNNLVTGEQGVTITRKHSRIDADKAIFDLEKNIYSLTRIKTVYYEKS